MNTSILFESQSMIHVLCLFVAFMYAKRKIVKINFRGLMRQRAEWISLCRYFVTIRLWNMLLIRLNDKLLSNIVKFFNHAFNYLKGWLGVIEKKLKQKHVINVRKCTQDILLRLEKREKLVLYRAKKRNIPAHVLLLNIK